jgi:hypothetical protein
MSNSVNACRHFMLAVVEDAAFCAGLSRYLIGRLDVREACLQRRRCDKDRRLKYTGRAAVLCPPPNGGTGQNRLCALASCFG